MTWPLYPQGKSPRYPLVRRMGGPQRRSGQRGGKIWPYRDSNSDPYLVEPVASLYTDHAIPSQEKLDPSQKGKLLDELSVAQLLKNIPTFHGIHPLICILSPLSLFWKIKESFWDHLAVYVYPLFVARQRPSKHVPKAMNTYTTIEVLLDASFYMLSM
jgi:hypothetical protein